MPLVCFSSYRVTGKNEAVGVINPPFFAQTPFLKKNYRTERTWIGYKDKLQNCSCKQFG
jgi:hypothetical protein